LTTEIDDIFNQFSDDDELMTLGQLSVIIVTRLQNMHQEALESFGL